MGKDKAGGKISLGPRRARGRSRRQWGDALGSPREQTAQSHNVVEWFLAGPR